MNSHDRRRLEDLQAQHDTAERLRREATETKDRAWFRAANAVLDGTASLKEYGQTVRFLVPDEIKPWRATLTLGSARRELGLDVGYRHPSGWHRFVVGDVLSYAPRERLKPTDREALERLDATWRDPVADPDLRLECALARLAIGPGAGEEQRAELWRAAHKRARKKFCHPLKWRNQGLLANWNELDDALAERSKAERQADQIFVTPYEAFERLLHELYSGRGSLS
jgi:hypothetical protein